MWMAPKETRIVKIGQYLANLDNQAEFKKISPYIFY